MFQSAELVLRLQYLSFEILQIWRRISLTSLQRVPADEGEFLVAFLIHALFEFLYVLVRHLQEISLIHHEFHFDARYSRSLRQFLLVLQQQFIAVVGDLPEFIYLRIIPVADIIDIVFVFVIVLQELLQIIEQMLQRVQASFAQSQGFQLIEQECVLEENPQGRPEFDEGVRQQLFVQDRRDQFRYIAHIR